MDVSQAQESQTSSAQSCKAQNMRLAISLSGFSWIIWPLLVWYKWLPKQAFHPTEDGVQWLQYKCISGLQTLRGLLWALVLGADCWWISSGGVHQHIKEVVIVQIICNIAGSVRAGDHLSMSSKAYSVAACWSSVQRKYGGRPKTIALECKERYCGVCNDSPTALFNFSKLSYDLRREQYSELKDPEFIKHYKPWRVHVTRNSYNNGVSSVDLERGTLASRSKISLDQERREEDHSSASTRSEKLREQMSIVFDKYVRKESKAYKRLWELYEVEYRLNGQSPDTDVFEDLLVGLIVSGVSRWGHYSRFWENAFHAAGVLGWPPPWFSDKVTDEFWGIIDNYPHGLYNADVVDRDYILKNCKALVNEINIRMYFPGILEVEDSDLNSDARNLRDAMRSIEIHLNKKVFEDEVGLMEICLPLGQSASSAIKTAPGFKSLRTELIKEFVRIKWSSLGILLTLVYVAAGTWLYRDHNREAALQWFRSAIGSGVLVLLQGTAKTSSQRKRCIRMMFWILLSVGLHALIAARDSHPNWFVRWRGLIWSSLWITWLFPMLEYQLYGKYRYGTTCVAFLTFFGRVIDGVGGVYVAIFLGVQY